MALIPTATGGFSIGGRVTDQAGVGAEGIVATACGRPCTSSTTAGDGSYVIRDLAPGDYSIDFFDPTGRLASGFAAAHGAFTVTSEDALNVGVGQANVAGVDVRLPLGLELTGIVYTPDGAPAANVGVFACPGIQSRGCHGGWSGADGHYRVRGLADRAYVVATNSDGRYGRGYYSLGGYTNIYEEAGLVWPGTGFDLRLVVGYRIAGIVTDDAGRPIAGLQVGVCFTCSGAVTDGAGGYEVKGLIPGEYVVTFRDPVAGQMVDPSISVTITGADVVGINARITEPPPAAPSSMPTATPAPSPTFPRTPLLASLPVRGSGERIGDRILLAPGPDGSLFVSIPGPSGAVVAALDRSGRPRLGWPIAVLHSTGCGGPLPVDDGSVRIICDGTDLPQFDNDASDVRAFAFDASGRLMAGWPVEIRPPYTSGGAGNVVGDELIVLEEQQLTDVFDIGMVDHEAWLTRIAANGTIRRGTATPMVSTCCGEQWAIGPDEVAYASIHHFGDAPEAPKSSELIAVGPAGVPAGFPIAIDGIASEPAFDAAGQIHVIVLPLVGPSRTLVFDPDGRAVVGGSGELGIRASDDCVGIEGSCEVPAAPLVGRDGTTFVIEARYNSTTMAGVSPSGQVMPGWPYRSVAGYQRTTGGCCTDDVDRAFNLAAPAIGPGNIVYLIHAAASASVGGSIVAVGPNGRVRPGWPIELRRPGAEFWSVVVGSDGTVYALAIEPERGDTSSASILAIAPDSTVRWTTTIIEP